MSLWIEDYIPFDYMRYGTEILPAIEQAMLGDTSALSEIIASATHFSVKLRLKYILPLPEEQRKALWPLWRFHGLFDAATLRRIKAGEVWNPWEAVTSVLPTLEGKSLKSLGTYGEMLKYHLLATFCCEVPPWSKNWPKPRRRFPSDEPYTGPILPHDETVFLWHEYRKRDAETQALWEAFYRPAPSDLENLLHIDDEQRSSQLYKDLPRYIPTETDTESEMHISGFLTVKEIRYLLEHVRTHERPELDSIIDGCVRDGEGMDWDIDVEALSNDVIKSKEEIGGEVSWHYVRRKGLHINQRAIFEQWRKAHPVEMDKFVENYYRWIHMVEDEILHRMRFAVERGWGILVMSAK